MTKDGGCVTCIISSSNAKGPMTCHTWDVDGQFIQPFMTIPVKFLVLTNASDTNLWHKSCTRHRLILQQSVNGLPSFMAQLRGPARQ